MNFFRTVKRIKTVFLSFFLAAILFFNLSAISYAKTDTSSDGIDDFFETIEIRKFYENGCSNRFTFEVYFEEVITMPGYREYYFEINHEKGKSGGKVLKMEPKSGDVISGSVTFEDLPEDVHYPKVRLRHDFFDPTVVDPEVASFYPYHRWKDGGQCILNGARISKLWYAPDGSISTVEVTVYDFAYADNHKKTAYKRYKLIVGALSYDVEAHSFGEALGFPVDAALSVCEEIPLKLLAPDGTVIDGSDHYINGDPQICSTGNGTCLAQPSSTPGSCEFTENKCNLGSQPQGLNNCRACRCVNDINNPPPYDNDGYEDIPVRGYPSLEPFSLTSLRNWAGSIQRLLVAIGVLSSIFILPYIGVLLASGDPENIKKGKEWLLSLVSGLLLLFLSGTIIRLVGTEILSLALP